MSNSYKDFSDALKTTAQTKHGKLVLEYLYNTYVRTSVIADDVNSTYYKLGQSELVRDLMTVAYSDVMVQEINMIKGE